MAERLDVEVSYLDAVASFQVVAAVVAVASFEASSCWEIPVPGDVAGSCACEVEAYGAVAGEAVRLVRSSSVTCVQVAVANEVAGACGAEATWRQVYSGWTTCDAVTGFGHFGRTSEEVVEDETCRRADRKS